MKSNNEVVVVTGGASGIGLECAIQASERGARVAIFDVNEETALRAIGQLSGGPHLAVGVNVTDAEAVRTSVARVQDDLGALSGVIAAVGIVNREPLRDISVENFRSLFSINVEGVQNIIAASVPHLEKSEYPPAIVVLGSAAADNGGGLMGAGAYAATKAALVGLVRGYARELAPANIRVNIVSPAATDTPMTSELSEKEKSHMISNILLGRFCLPAEIASTVSFLLGAGAGAITGQTIRPNAGVYFA